MRKFVGFLLSIIVILSSLAFSACGSTFSTYSFSAFGSEVFITVKGELSSQVKKEIKDLTIALDNEFSTTNTNSLIYNLNENSTPNALSNSGIEVFNLSKKYATLTNGKFSPAIYPLTDLWQLSASKFSFDNTLIIPSELEISSTKLLCNFDDFTLDENGKINKVSQEQKLDFGGIIKGFAADKIFEILTKNEFSEGYVRIGGSSLYILSIPTDLKIKHPRKSGEFIVSVKNSTLNSTPLSTSGDYERYYEKDGERYCHIINASTGAPIKTNISTATIFGVSGAFTDALSTAVSCYNFSADAPSELTEFLSSTLSNNDYKNMKFIIVHEQTKKIITNFEKDEITILDSVYSIYKI